MEGEVEVVECLLAAGVDAWEGMEAALMVGQAEVVEYLEAAGWR